MGRFRGCRGASSSAYFFPCAGQASAPLAACIDSAGASKLDAARPEKGGKPMLTYSAYFIPVVAFVVVVRLAASVRILREYERAVVFALRRFQRVKELGLVLLIPFIQEMVRVDLRIQVIETPSQDVISRDNVAMKIDAVLYFNVVNPERAIVKAQDYLPATNMLAQTTLRAALGQHELDEMLSERKTLSADVQGILDSRTETWESRSATSRA
jgi:regulator of protease activity HflC (stomatin/prohibitin superfamily)